MLTLNFFIIFCVLLAQTSLSKRFLLTRKERDVGTDSYPRHPFLEESSNTIGPKINMQYLKNDTNYYAEILYDDDRQIIYFLTFQILKPSKNSSNLYVSTNFGGSIRKIELSFNDSKSIIDGFETDTKLLILNERKQKVIFSSVDGGTTFKSFQFNHSIDEIFIHPSIELTAAVIDEVDQLYITTDGGSTWGFISSQVDRFIWSEKSNYYYFVKKSFVESITYELMRSNLDKLGQYQLVVPGCFFVSKRNNVVYGIVRTRDNKTSLVISYDDDVFRPAVFPSRIVPKFFSVHQTTKHEIFVTVLNETDNVILYSGIKEELKFTKVLDKIGYATSNKEKLCAYVEFFDNLPGLLISRVTDDRLQRFGRKTYISYSHGSKWAHIVSPKYVGNKLCEWPNCFLDFELSCDTYTGESLIMVDKSPNLIVGHGTIYNGTSRQTTGLFMSADAGYSWYQGPKYYHDISILDHGSIIVTNLYSKNVIFYSYDQGLSWSYKVLNNNNFIGVYMHHDSKGVPTSAIEVGFDGTTDEWVFINLDFREAITNKCSISDYELFTPGVEERSKCFQGRKNTFYKRTLNVTCLSIIDTLVSNQSTVCPCTADDFGCSFGYYMNNNVCVVDDDADDTTNSSEQCSYGDPVYSKSATSKLHGDVCINKGNITEETANFCGFTYDDNVITIFTSLRIYFINLKDKTILTELPINNYEKIKPLSVDIDLKGRCLYYIEGDDINRICWSTKDGLINQQKTVFLRDYKPISLHFDDFGRNLFVQTSNDIIAVSVDKRYVYSYNLRKELTYLKLFPLSGIIVGAESYKINHFIFAKVLILSFTGAELDQVIIEEIPQAIEYIPANRSILIYGKTKFYVYVVGGTGAIVFNSPLDVQDIVEYFVDSEDNYTVTTNYIQSGSKKLATYSRGMDARLHLESSNKQNGCLYSICAYLCLPVPGSSYSCVCPDQMDSGGSGCECKDSFPNCTACGAQEFQCVTGECIDILDKCDGVPQCEDASDEQNCVVVCQKDEFICPNNEKCVLITKRCDGYNDCPDGFDEKDCKYQKCKDDEFTCNNDNCIAREKYCDGVNDCGDYSDEQKCAQTKCLPREFTCDNGECISISQVCDGIFDCSDWSDETRCKAKKDNRTDECAIFCDNKCISINKVCDHITDCSDNSDELECDHKIYCPNQQDFVCAKDFTCISKKYMCDNFTDCSDGSDELNCPKTDACTLLDNFVCMNIFECISLNDLCDGTKHCSDNSDEDNICGGNTIHSLGVESINISAVAVDWKVSKNAWNPTSLVTSFEWGTTENRTNLEAHGIYHAEIGNMETCRKYYVSVKDYQSKSGRYVQFLKHSTVRQAPRDLLTDKDGVIQWKYDFYECEPVQFFINCTSSNGENYRNFTRDVKISLNRKYEVCNVCACPTNVFNLSCSSFINVTNYSTSLNSTKISLIVIGTLVLMAIVTFILRKQYKNGNISKAFDGLSRLFSFRLRRSQGFRYGKRTQDTVELINDEDIIDLD